MRLETFVDIMGINVVQVIERIQQPGLTINQPPCPDEFLNPDWPGVYNNTRYAGDSLSICERGELLSNSTKRSQGVHSKQNYCVPQSEGYSFEETNGTTARAANEEGLVNVSNSIRGIRLNEDDNSEQPLSLPTIGATDCSVFRRPNKLRLISGKDFLKDSVKSFSDAVRTVHNGSMNIVKFEKTGSLYEREESVDNLLVELLPLHVSFYNKFNDQTAYHQVERTR